MLPNLLRQCKSFFLDLAAATATMTLWQKQILQRGDGNRRLGETHKTGRYGRHATAKSLPILPTQYSMAARFNLYEGGIKIMSKHPRASTLY